MVSLQILALENLKKEVDEMKFSVHASSILDVETVAKPKPVHTKTVSYHSTVAAISWSTDHYCSEMRPGT